MSALAATTTGPRRPWYRQLYFWVMFGIAAGIVVGGVAPGTAVQLQPLGDMFVGLIKMVITPIIFCTVVSGIAGVDSLRRVGRIGLKSLLYFEAMTTLALVLGLVAMNVLHPGSGVHADVSNLKVSEKVAGFISTGEHQGTWSFFTDLIPSSAVGAFANGNVLQVLVFAILFAIALKLAGPPAAGVAAGVEKLSLVLFAILRVVMYAAPIGAFGAMAFTVGKYGLHTLTSLGSLIGIFYGTSAIFVLVVLGGVCALCRVNIFSLLRYIKGELLVVLGTSSSETVLPSLMNKLEHLGVPRQVVGLTVPTGYSFNLDGTCIYLTLASLYIAQATGVHLSLTAQLGIVAILLLTSKGAAGVTGSGFIVLAATLSAVGTIPVAGIMLVFGIDKFMSECRALTNVCGNAVGTVVIAAWEGVLDRDRMHRVLSGQPVPAVPLPEPATFELPVAAPLQPALVH